MARIRKDLHVCTETAKALRATYEVRAGLAEPGSNDDWRRNHLGASILGHKCERFLWLSFRWAVYPQHDGRQLRLFERGEREEQWVIRDLRLAGASVYGEQSTVELAPHVGGHCDGLVFNVPGAPDGKVTHVLEVKTHSLNSFRKLQADGVKRAKPEHWAQMQCYMLGLRLEWALYVAYCKDNDEEHVERVAFDREAAEGFVARARAIVAAPVPPDRMDKDFPPCVYTGKDGKRWPCQFLALCHGAQMPVKSCRSCVSATPRDDGSWLCEHRDEVPDGLAQRKGCADYMPIPQMVNGQVAEVDEAERRIRFQMADGKLVCAAGGAGGNR